MIIYKPLNFAESFDNDRYKEFNNEQEMKEFTVNTWLLSAGRKRAFLVEDIVIDNEIFNDELIGWEDSRYVCVKRMGDKDLIALYDKPIPIGSCATKYKLQNELIMRKTC